MGLSAKKLTKIEKAARNKEVNERSLNGLGYFMDGNHDHYAQKYIETGDPGWLELLPDYRPFR